MTSSPNAVWHPVGVTRGDRERRNGHRGVALWFTGLPNAGKSTLAHAVERQLFAQGCRSMFAHGDFFEIYCNCPLAALDACMTQVLELARKAIALA